MNDNSLSRREFLKTSLFATAVLGGLIHSDVFAGSGGSRYNAKGLPTRTLGKTGVPVPLIGIGCGSRFCSVKDPEKSTGLLEYVLDNGFYYWDTAYIYAFEGVVSEERLGLVLKNRRDEVFLATKVAARSYDGAMRQLEESLKRLQTDRLDLLQIHLVQSLEDVEAIGAKTGVLAALRKLKDEKVTRFIGFTGHLSAEAMRVMTERYEFDTMLIALNHYSDLVGDAENSAVPAAADKNLGISVMKVIRPRETVVDVTPEELIRYALSLKHVHAAVIGTDSLEVAKANLSLLNAFRRMSAGEISGMTARMQPFFTARNLPWMQPGYCDSRPVWTA